MNVPDARPTRAKSCTHSRNPRDVCRCGPAIPPTVNLGAHATCLRGAHSGVLYAFTPYRYGAAVMRITS
eukprot:7702710-Pyramimonas_sp.AAC.1